MVSEVVTLEGHIIDSKTLGTVMDDILSAGGEFKILEVGVIPKSTEEEGEEKFDEDKYFRSDGN